MLFRSDKLLSGRSGDGGSRDRRSRDLDSRDGRRERFPKPDRGEEFGPKRRRRGSDANDDLSSIQRLIEDDERGVSRGKETFRVEVGRVHGVKPGNIVGAIANEIGMDSNDIGHIRIHHDHSTVDLPAGMPRDVFKVLGRAWVVGRQLRISKLKDHPSERGESPRERRRSRDHAPRPDAVEEIGRAHV